MYRISTLAYRLLFFVALVVQSAIFTSCLTEIAEGTDTPLSGPTSKVRILTRSDEGEGLQYPLHVYGFTPDGALIAEQEIETADDALELVLPKAQPCHIVVVAASKDVYEIPEQVSQTSVISMKKPVLPANATDFDRQIAQGFVTDSPIQMGSADVIPQSESATVSIQLHYQVASLDVSLQGLGETCTSVFLSVSSPYAGISLEGQGSGSQVARIPLSPNPDRVGEWHLASPVYLFPTVGNATFTIAYTDVDGEQYSAVNYLAPLRASSPYQLRGTQTEKTFAITGTVSPSTWADPIVLDFSFEPSSNTTIDASGSNPGSGVNLSELPQPLSVYQGHIVVAILDDEGLPLSSLTNVTVTNPSLLLFSLSDWDNLSSTKNTTSPTQAFSLAEGYTEFSLSDWRIPTEAEARYLSQLYRENSEDFDKVLLEAEADAIVTEKRYLCVEAQKTFSFSTSTVIDGGTSVKDYHLRLVKTLPVNLLHSTSVRR